MPYIYAFLNSKKSFNPSATVFSSLSISTKVAEGFEKSILQHGSATDGAGGTHIAGIIACNIPVIFHYAPARRATRRSEGLTSALNA